VSAIDLNEADKHEALVNAALSVAIDEAIDRVALAAARPTRGYLGASAIGGDCERKTQFDWLVDGFVDARQARIFGRGHFFEAAMRAQMLQAGFEFAPDSALAFIALDGRLQGHADGLLIAAPAMPGIYLQLPCVWEAKAIKHDGWVRLAREGLAKAYPAYLTQVQLYMRFLDKRNPTLFSAVDANTCKALHFLVPYDETLVEEAVERAKRVIAATERGDLLRRGHPSPDSWQCKRGCGHAERCWRYS
jgi:hypothetical protein